MRRGEIYRVPRPEGDTTRHRSFVLVSRQRLIDSAYSTVVCAPIFTQGDALSTQVRIGPEQGLKHESWIACDNLRSIRKSDLTQFVGSLSGSKLAEVDEALRVALALD
ncbi:MAG TPA: type II toxin-antitoxin system PemK/MazF family toxin [Candidatus Solibacter sp.]|nr:type II toxin-antitoxin system PemK/MazF family toxin [Candidatus Solibacter sp.]